MNPFKKLKYLNIYPADLILIGIVLIFFIGVAVSFKLNGLVKENTVFILNSTTKEEFLQNLNLKKEYDYYDVCKKAYSLKVKLSEIEKIQYVCKGVYSDIIELEKLDNSLPF